MRILIIEDEYSLADVLRETFKKENYLSDIATDGEEGLNQALTNIYDLIILDVMLPKLNGFDVLKQIRSAKIMTPILMLTAKSELTDKLEGFDNGTDDYLTKPFNTKELLARIKALTRRKGEITLEKTIFDDLELDSKTCTITCLTNQKSIKLGLKEYLLLEYLIANQNIAVTKEQIVEKIWGFDGYDLEYNNAEVYISFLRKKINFVESKVRIKAIRNVGYIIEVQND